VNRIKRCKKIITPFVIIFTVSQIVVILVVLYVHQMNLNQNMKKEHPNAKVSVTVKEVPRLKWKDEIDRVKQKSGIERNPHRTSPMVFEGCTALEMNRNFVGGYSDFLDTLQQQYQFHSSQC